MKGFAKGLPTSLILSFNAFELLFCFLSSLFPPFFISLLKLTSSLFPQLRYMWNHFFIINVSWVIPWNPCFATLVMFQTMCKVLHYRWCIRIMYSLNHFTCNLYIYTLYWKLSSFGVAFDLVGCNVRNNLFVDLFQKPNWVILLQNWKRAWFKKSICLTIKSFGQFESDFALCLLNNACLVNYFITILLLKYANMS